MGKPLDTAITTFGLARHDLVNAHEAHKLLTSSRHFTSNELAASFNLIKELEDRVWSAGTDLLAAWGVENPEAPCL